MQDQDNTNPYDKWNAIVTLFIDSGLAANKPHIKKYCDKYLLNLDYSGLEDLLTRHPNLIEQAKTLAIEKQRQAVPFTPPSTEEALLLQGHLKTGIINNYNNWLNIDFKHMVDNILVFGQRGSGKSYFFFMLIFQLMLLPKEERPNIIILDRKDDYPCLLNFFPDMYYLDAHTLHDNMWEVPEGHDPKTYLTAQTNLLCDINYFRATSHPIIKKAVGQCYRKFGSFNFEDILKEVQAYGSKNKLQGWGIKEVLGKIHIRFDSFISESSLNKAKSMPVEFWQNNDFILNLRGFNEDTAKTFVMSIWERLYQDNMLKNKRNIPATIFICDESYWLFNVEDRHELSAQKTLADRMRTSREFGIGVIAGAQNSNDLNDVIKGNSPHIFSFRILSQTINEAQTLLGLTDDQRDFILNLPAKLSGIARIAHYPEPILFTVPQGPQFDKNITEAEIQQIMNPKLESMLKTIMPESFDVKLDHIEDLILNIIAGSPFTYFTPLRDQVRKQTGINNDQFEIKIKSLKDKELITSIKCVNTINHISSEFFPLTDKAHEYLNPVHHFRIKDRTFKHTFYCAILKSYLKKQGHKSSREYVPKYYENKHERIDVAYFDKDKQLHAYEITLSFGNLVGNVLKCIRMDAKQITIVTEYKRDKKNAMERIEAKIKDKATLSMIFYRSIGEFIPKKGAK